MLLERVEAGKPVQVSTCVFFTWICFMDGACENQASVGGVLIDPRSRAVASFGGFLPKDLDEIFYLDSRHPIYEVELFPVMISRLLWSDHLNQWQVVYYLDNDAA